MLTLALATVVLVQALTMAVLLRRPRPVRYDSLESAVDATTRVVAGLHEDIDALRAEVRALALLPPPTAVPQIVRELQILRVGFLVQTIVLIAMVGYLLAHPGLTIAGVR